MCRMEIYCKRCDYDLHVIPFVDIVANFAWETNLIEHTDKGIYYKLIRKLDQALLVMSDPLH